MPLPHPPRLRGAINARLLMRPAWQGAGIVLSWNSLDDGKPTLHYFPDAFQVTGWGAMNGYVRRFGDYEFLISDPPLPQTPPVENPFHGPLDTAMLAEFGARFDEMNADVAASIARTAATPAIPAPPGERRFWRLAVDSSRDSDGDGTPDWLEFGQLFAEAAGGAGLEGPSPDPYNDDTDGDGIPDGKQRSSDGDGIPDDADADMNDPMIAWRKKQPVRFALFPIPLEAGEIPLQINSRGEVLLSDSKLYQSGKIRALANTTVDLSDADPKFLDDLGRVYGTGVLNFDASNSSSCLICWPENDGDPKDLQSGDWHMDNAGIFEGNLPDMFAMPQVDGSFAFAATCMVRATENGQTIFSPINGTHLSSVFQWKIAVGSEAGVPVVSRIGDSLLVDAFAVSPDGEPIDQGGNATNVRVNGVALPSSGFLHVARLPKGERMPESGEPLPTAGDLIAFSPYEPPLIRHNGIWAAPKSIGGPCVDASATTGYIFRSDGRVWQNGRTWAATNVFPGFGADGPTKFVHKDAAPAGFLLTSFEGKKPDGAPVSVPCLGVPVSVALNAVTGENPYQGIDVVSVTSYPQEFRSIPNSVPGIPAGEHADGNGWQNRTWIMVPAAGPAPVPGGPPDPDLDPGTSVEISVPKMMPGAKVKIIPGSSRLTVQFGAEATAGDIMSVLLTATAGGTEETGLKLELSNSQGGVANTSPNAPIGVKIMKRRTVKVALHPMVLRKAGQPDNPPDLFPASTGAEKAATKKMVEDRLNDIYGQQVNAFFDVEVLDPVFADYDAAGVDGAGIGYFGIGERASASPDRRSPDNGANIDIWALGGVTLTFTGVAPQKSATGDWEEILGFAFPGPNQDPRIILNGDFGTLTNGHFVPAESARKPLLDALAHEIGHVLIGRGHPDGPTDMFHLHGPAPLPETDRAVRLMSRTANLDKPATLLVKAEWDKIEEWLKMTLDGGISQ